MFSQDGPEFIRRPREEWPVEEAFQSRWGEGWAEEVEGERVTAGRAQKHGFDEGEREDKVE